MQMNVIENKYVFSMLGPPQGKHWLENVVCHLPVRLGFFVLPGLPSDVTQLADGSSPFLAPWWYWLSSFQILCFPFMGNFTSSS